MTSRGERTRELLIEVAERLFGERGVDSVSLREINQSAGQRNASALQYYFGDRDGLMRAIAEKHQPRLVERQKQLYDELIESGREKDLRGLVEVLIRPTAEYVGDGPSARAWVKMVAELAPRPQRTLAHIRDEASPASIDAGIAIIELLMKDMPRTFAVERLLGIAQSAIHICADRARLEDATDAGREPSPRPLFIANLIDMMCGALQAPVSKETAALRQPSSTAEAPLQK